MTITLTPELESALTERAQQQGTTPELLALHDLKRLYADPTVSNGLGGQALADFLAARTGRMDSRQQNAGKSSRLSKMRRVSANIWKKNVGGDTCRETGRDDADRHRPSDCACGYGG